MKKFILSILVIGIFIKLSAQKPETSYFDKYWMPCSELLAKNYTKSYAKDEVWIVDYYNKADKIVRRQLYLLEDKITKIGTWLNWYPDGQLLSEITYNKEGDGTGTYTEWYENGQVAIKGNRVEGKSNGEWIYYYENGNKGVQLNYEMDSVLTQKFWNSDGSIHESEISNLDELKPTYPGGVDSLVNDIYGKIYYPELARENGIEGMVVIYFIVDKNGKVKNVRVQRSVHPILDKEALRVVLEMKRWEPGKLIYEDQFVSYNLPIKFKLEDDYIDEE